MTTRLLVGLAILAAPRAALACPVCFSSAGHSPMIDAALIGVIALMAVTLGVLGGFAAFMRRVARLSKAYDADATVRVQWDQTEDR